MHAGSCCHMHFREFWKNMQICAHENNFSCSAWKRREPWKYLQRHAQKNMHLHDVSCPNKRIWNILKAEHQLNESAGTVYRANGTDLSVWPPFVWIGTAWGKSSPNSNAMIFHVCDTLATHSYHWEEDRRQVCVGSFSTVLNCCWNVVQLGR